MSTISYDLTLIKAFIFDVDGVLSPNAIPLALDGTPMRLANIKDGFALNLAARNNYGLAIITGGDADAVRVRYESLGFRHIYMKSHQKMRDYNDYIQKTGYKPEEVIYIGDDLPDYKVMQAVGLSVAPADAAEEIKSIAKYVSHVNGGEGVARDVIEQVMKAQGKWMGDDAFGW